MARYIYSGLGQAGMMITSAAINAALDVYSAKKLGKMAERFGKQLESDAIKMEYITYVVSRLRSLCEMLVATTDTDPHSLAFEAMLREGMSDYIQYKGNCNCTLLDPNTKKPVATLTKDGRVLDGPGIPPEVGLIWATGCKNALDFARATNIREIKDEDRFQKSLQQTQNLGTRDLYYRYVLGGLVVSFLVLVLAMQRKVIKS